MKIKTPELILHCFVCHYDNRTIAVNDCIKYLSDKHNKSFTQYILDYNNLQSSDLPKCKICNDRSVEILPPVTNPTLSECCNNHSCRIQYYKEVSNG